MNQLESLMVRLETYHAEARAFGASDDDVQRYERMITRFAQQLMYPNQDILRSAYDIGCMRLATGQRLMPNTLDEAETWGCEVGIYHLGLGSAAPGAAAFGQTIIGQMFAVAAKRAVAEIHAVCALQTRCQARYIGSV